MLLIPYRVSGVTRHFRVKIEPVDQFRILFRKIAEQQALCFDYNVDGQVTSSFTYRKVVFAIISNYCYLQGSMATIVFSVCVVLCVGVTIFAVKVVKETRKMAPKQQEEDEDENWS